MSDLWKSNIDLFSVFSSCFCFLCACVCMCVCVCVCSVDQMFHELQSEGEDPGVVKVRYSQRGSMSIHIYLNRMNNNNNNHSHVLSDQLLCSFIM